MTGSMSIGENVAGCSGSGGCPCTCNYATDSTCQCRDLAQALNVTITKSAVYASYPLIYQQAFNYQPYEVSNTDAANVTPFQACITALTGLASCRYTPSGVTDFRCGASSSAGTSDATRSVRRQSSGQVEAIPSPAVSTTPSAPHPPVAGPLTRAERTCTPARASAAPAPPPPSQRPPLQAAPISVRPHTCLRSCQAATQKTDSDACGPQSAKPRTCIALITRCAHRLPIVRCDVQEAGGHAKLAGRAAETRANLDCDLLHTWFPTLASASCLRMDPLYYQVHAPFHFSAAE